ncbi:MAG TPA: glutamine--fructose-6-phosphate transaminase (isomerizing) [Candidatus Paceibacterota bacterium]
MCGIFAYTGNKKALPLLVNGLLALEYRGYDSAGIYTSEDGLFRSEGAVAKLIDTLPEEGGGTCGIAHTRWATHGVPSQKNAHPHAGGKSKGVLHLVHNGIIENYRELKEELMAKGYEFLSDTDSEVLAQLIAHDLEEGLSPKDALVSALSRVRGTYGIAVIFSKEPDTIYAAALGSPILLGVGDGEMCVASDASAIAPYTKKIVYLKDGEYVVVTPTSYEIRTLNHEIAMREPEIVDIDVTAMQKKGYPHFMLKEIMEAPEVLKNTIRGRLNAREGTVKLGGLESVADTLKSITRLTITACGSAYFAGLYGKTIIEEYAKIPVDVVLGSEMRYRPIFTDGSEAVLAISQSGETADTLASVKEAKKHGLLTLGLVNVVGSTIAREVDAGVYTHAGPEIGVASTKAFVSQLVALALLALYLGRMRNLSDVRAKELAEAVAELPQHIEEILERKEEIEKIAKKYANVSNMLYIGRKYNVSTAYEGALKVKEVAYLHAEGYPAGEMKHGPIAMIDEKFPTLAIAPSDSVYEKMISNIEEIRARKGPVIALATDGNKTIEKIADDVLWIPKTIESLTPIIATVPLQLFAYYTGVALGHNVDRPRNLAKAVTVE